MKSVFKPGDNKIYKRIVSEADVAVFHGQVVHKVCSTFTLARDMEWSSRLFVLEMKEEDEEGIGTALSVEHIGPAFPGEEIIYKATVSSIEKNEIICTIEATAAGRKVAMGTTGQKVIPKEKLNQYFANLKQNGQGK